MTESLIYLFVKGKSMRKLYANWFEFMAIFLYGE